MPGIAFIEMTKKDIVRHKLVSRIVEAYDAYAQKKEMRDEKMTPGEEHSTTTENISTEN